MIPPIHSPSFLQSYICFMLIPPLPLMSIIVFHPLYSFWLFLSFLLLDYYLLLLRSSSTLSIVLYHVKYSRLEILLNPLTRVLLCVLLLLDLPLPLILLSKPLALSGSYPLSRKLIYS
ncbi:hypothetical protein BDP27DRAFT_1331230 [Rhodocollybia butyracea]|uniref:Uncharacterized protein n=1 Tax=Rhodocollybia butyracea TaxID=206335 RepID=A0A9P5U4T1_9AGAR|nr:hypothetical protein BDP27DRAFT_1331230 [Rhodocollybia butyracea]